MNIPEQVQELLIIRSTVTAVPKSIGLAARTFKMIFSGFG